MKCRKQNRKHYWWKINANRWIYLKKNKECASLLCSCSCRGPKRIYNYFKYIFETEIHVIFFQVMKVLWKISNWSRLTSYHELYIYKKEFSSQAICHVTFFKSSTIRSLSPYLSARIIHILHAFMKKNGIIDVLWVLKKSTR
jgi:hypothetical protein